ncbi:hypothetical protein M438DRAFT_359256 [Aureobasidium pullulans EXF-150]|uniref:Uncharacterized protein n=1 Tax=Aureobasidium pullulans EXF-150 TaxID=1043002 RepID=A0A074X7T1_AURPU|nr:uncharacterized protein M438DRAFT_359256 [Aureobasidium pullulans EXF-150]KEQ79819.1 hypothetical protein M438DRAFT_359256 [Aureobasidium pullulans EXF-150]
MMMLPRADPTPSASSISPTTVYGITPTAFPTYPSHLYRPQATETSAWDTLWRSPKSFSNLLIFIPLFLGTIVCLLIMLGFLVLVRDYVLLESASTYGERQQTRKEELLAAQAMIAEEEHEKEGKSAAIWFCTQEIMGEDHELMFGDSRPTIRVVAVYTAGVGLKVTLPKFAASRVEKLKMQQFDDEGVWGEDWDNASKSDSRAGWICLGWNRDGNEGVQTAVDAWMEKWDATVARDWDDWIRGFLGEIVNQRCEVGWELLRTTGAAGSSTIRCERCR